MCQDSAQIATKSGGRFRSPTLAASPGAPRLAPGCGTPGHRLGNSEWGKQASNGETVLGKVHPGMVRPVLACRLEDAERQRSLQLAAASPQVRPGAEGPQSPPHGQATSCYLGPGSATSCPRDQKGDSKGGTARRSSCKKRQQWRTFKEQMKATVLQQKGQLEKEVAKEILDAEQQSIEAINA